jgi:hypothetical protein
MSDDRQKSIYVVFGKTGEYDDYRDWPVTAFLDETEAEKHAEAACAWLANKLAQTKHKTWEAVFLDEGHTAMQELADSKSNPYDPKMEIDYTGTDWYVVEIPLKTAVDNDTSVEARQKGRE